MIQLEIDGQSIEVNEGTMLIEAAKKAGQYVPHFCYHKKLSIAANCRMCLVDVEKAPKPLPACATPVTQGMKVFTNSQKAKDAQKSVMEFLLINHPLDCPICDQGGECQLQDLAVGYGGIQSRYQEEKRIIFHKSAGPLISMEEMSRCIHCTRCVRFGQEIAGVMEFGMVGRGEHSEITSFVGKTIDSELSGNMIDLCPVGALTSKPFRYSARTWELSRRLSISSHDSLGSNIVVQIKDGKVMRVLPHENEAINECWISDKDRFSYEGLYHNQRLLQPMLKDDQGMWHEVEWIYAFQTFANKMHDVKQQADAHIAGLFNAQHTNEEIFLFKKLLQGLGSDTIDFRLKHSDVQADEYQTAIGLNGLKITDFSNYNEYKQMSFIGSALRNDHPLLCARVRQASKFGVQVHSVHALSAQDWLMPITSDHVLAPHQWLTFMQEVHFIVCGEKNLKSSEASISKSNTILSKDIINKASQFAQFLLQKEKEQIIALGANTIYHPHRHIIHHVCQLIAEKLGCSFVVLPDACNTMGAYELGAYTSNNYQRADAYILMGVDLAYDVKSAQTLKTSLNAAKTVVACTSYLSTELLDCADILLPIATSFETSGSFINMQGDELSFQGVSKPVGAARPAWKVLKVMADTLAIDGFDYDSTATIKQDITLNTKKSMQDKYAKSLDIVPVKLDKQHQPLYFERISYQAIYHTDAMVRHSPSLQNTELAKKARNIYAHSSVFKQKKLNNGDCITLLQGQIMVNAQIYINDLLNENVILIPSACDAFQKLDGLYGDIAIEKYSA